MAISPTKWDRMDVDSKGKVYVWLTPTISAGGDTLQVSAIKEIWSLSVGNRPATTFTYTATGAASSCVVVTVTVTASCTGGATPLVIYGR